MIGTMEDRVREILIDSKESSYRWSPGVVFRGLRDGVKRLNSLRPESRYFGLRLVEIDFPNVDGSLTTEEIATIRDTDVLIDTRWIEAVVYYAVHKAYLFDNPYTANDVLAQRYLELFQGIARS